MLRIILLILLIILSCGLSDFKNDKAKDEPMKPIGDFFHKTMKNLSGHYKENIDADIFNLKDFGHISTMTGDYVFNICKNCGGPLLGHEKTEADCKEKRMDYKLSGKLQDEARKHDLFECYKAGIDMRPKEIECNECGNKFLNRLQRENHDRLIHNGKTNENKAKEMDDMAKIFASSNAGAMREVLTKVLKDNTEKKTITTQITKAKPPPVWIGGDFERFRDEIEAWDKNNADSTMTKYADLIESLKKNKNIKENDINVIQDKAREIGDKSVEKVMEILEEKYSKTTVEKTKDILKDILEFEMKKEENFEEYWDRCEILLTKCKREKINEKFYYMMAAMIVDKAEKNGKLTEEEKRRLNESIENEKDSDRIPKTEETVIENHKKEVKKLKIENNRSEIETKVHYGE